MRLTMAALPTLPLGSTKLFKYTIEEWNDWVYVRMRTSGDCFVEVMRDQVVVRSSTLSEPDAERIFEAWRLGSIFDLEGKFPTFDFKEAWNSPGWTPWMYIRRASCEKVVQIVAGDPSKCDQRAGTSGPVWDLTLIDALKKVDE